MEPKIDKKQQLLDNLVSYGLGEAIGELSDAQLEAIAATRITLKMSRVRFELTFKPNGKKAIEVSHKVTIPVLPKEPSTLVTMYPDENNLLHEQNPDGKELNMEDVADFTEHKNRKIKEV